MLLCIFWFYIERGEKHIKWIHNEKVYYIYIFILFKVNKMFFLRENKEKHTISRIIYIYMYENTTYRFIYVYKML